MRDRRNTNLSTASTGSINSASTKSGRNSPDEQSYLHSRPPSSTLPGPATKENRPRPRCLRQPATRILLAAICALLFTWGYIMLGWPISSDIPTSSAGEQPHGQETQLVAGNDLPDEPTVLATVDSNGSFRWTVSIPHHLAFPLSSRQYQDMCTEGTGLQRTISTTTRPHGSRHWWRERFRSRKDSTFLDIPDAERAGILPPLQDTTSDICQSSLTFVLELDEASFGKSLLLLWMSYGLARHEGRAFFLDDTRWAWGSYTSYFAAPPRPKCSPPPAHQRVPCPRSARHLVVSSATARWTFGSVFQDEFQVVRKHGVEAQARVYDLARNGFKALFKLTGEDALYAASRIAKLQDDAAAHGGSMVGMHIRRGDLHPFEYQYSRDYLPLERYARGARSLAQSLHRGTEALDDFSSHAESRLVLSSDDPDIMDSHELLQAAAPFSVQPVQERIQLATKKQLDKTSPVAPLRDGAYVKHVDENIGWEGGFYSALFYSLGGAKNSGATTTEHEITIPEQALRLRQLVGRAFLLDLAVLSVSDGVVCAISSASCRALGLMMGWDAVTEGRWMNVDDGRPWSWTGQR